MAAANLTPERVRELLHYNPETGVFVWLKTRSKKVPPGSVAGGVNKVHGYNQIKVDGIKLPAHRLAWLYVHGYWPNQIDHINGARADNRLSNLRDVTPQVNAQNVHKPRRDNKKSGLLGVGFGNKHRGPKKWTARVTVEGRRVLIGYFYTPEEAHAAYLSAKRRLHTGCTI